MDPDVPDRGGALTVQAGFVSEAVPTGLAGSWKLIRASHP